MRTQDNDEDWGEGYRDGLLGKPMQIVSHSYDAGYTAGKKVRESEITLRNDDQLD